MADPSPPRKINMPIRDKIAAFETNGPALSADLARFLDLAWSHRKNTRDGTYAAKNSDVYGLYTRSGRGTAPPEAITAFLREIQQFPVLPEIQCSPKDWLGYHLVKDYKGKQLPSGFMGVPRDGFGKMTTATQTNKVLRDQLGNTFYHFRRGGARSMERLYLHVHPLRATKVIRYIVDNMVLRPVAHPGMTNAKTGAPGRETRFDTLVLYFSSVPALEKGLEEIAKYQSTGNNRSLFEAGTTRATKEITEHKGIKLTGIGTGAEPPVAVQQHQGKIVLLPQSSSFGSFRSTLISFALEKTLAANEAKPKFVERVIRYFRAAGIDPKKPHAHGMAVELQHRAQVTLKQLQAGKEPTWGIV